MYQMQLDDQKIKYSFATTQTMLYFLSHAICIIMTDIAFYLNDISKFIQQVEWE